MRVTKRFLAVVAAGLMMFSGAAMASPPDDDPTCDNPGAQAAADATGQECPGDNGSPGCEGINIARQHTPEEADPAMDLVTDILSIGNEGECEDDQRAGRPGGGS
jgi:hypothetical protein